MIDVKFFQNTERGSVEMEMAGHAMMGPKGADLVCAAATTVAYTLAQAVQFLYEQERLLKKPEVQISDGYASIRVTPRKCALAETLMTFWVAQAGAFVLERNFPQAVRLMPMSMEAAA